MSCEHTNSSYICRTLRNIDQKQKEAIIAVEGCVTCESSLITSAYNTIPVSIILCGGLPLNAFLESLDSEETTRLFRIEEVIDCEVVKLRLIEPLNSGVKSNGGHQHQNYRCTNQTCLCNISCICCLECFPPIKCEHCHH